MHQKRNLTFVKTEEKNYHLGVLQFRHERPADRENESQHCCVTNSVNDSENPELFTTICSSS